MSIQARFDQAAADYDSSRRLLIPCYDDFYGIAVDLVSHAAGPSPHILDLGAGTGLLAERVLNHLPTATITLMDLSGKMLDHAQKRFRRNRDRVSFQKIDYITEPLGGPYDAVVSALSIHHLDAAQKQMLFAKLLDALHPAGIFVNADQIAGPTAAIDERYRQIWIKQVRERGVDDATLMAALERMQDDRLSPLADQISWLRKAGFEEVATWYQHYSFVVYAARKPPVTHGQQNNS